MKSVMLPFLFALIITSCTKQDGVETSPVNDPKLSEVAVTVNKSLLLQLVNDVRKKGCQCGDTYFYPTTPVTWNAQLETAAYTHSKDMYQNKYFSHVAPDGSNGGVRIYRAGYSWKAFSENIATGYSNEKAVIEGCIKSPGHCQNIMGKAYKEMGVARMGNYWTQDFASK